MEARFLKVEGWILEMSSALKWMLFLDWMIEPVAVRVQGYYINNPKVEMEMKNLWGETVCQIRD